MPERILVAYDDSPQAEAALDHVLSRYPDAAVTVLHVTDPREWIYADDMGGGYYSDEAFEQAQELADEVLGDAESTAMERGVQVTTASVDGRPENTIVQYAEEHDIDHIVLGSHGRTGLERFLLGSVAETVAKRAPVSVTIIRRADDEASG